MICETPASSTLDPSTLLNALRKGDYDGAATLLGASDANLPEQLQPLAEGLMRRRRWVEAAWLFGRIEPREPAAEMKRCLAMNLAATQAHRPDVYAKLIALPATDAFGIAASATGRPTILARKPDGSVTTLSGGSDPLAAAKSVFDQVKQATPNGEAVALCGLGDGYLLQLFAKHPRELFMDTEQSVFVIEPEPQVLLHAMMIHDLSDAAGPIAAERFRWFIGTDYSEQLNDAVRREPSIGVPGVTLQQGLDSSAVQASVQACLRDVIERDATNKRKIESYYTALMPTTLADVFGGEPTRKPRVMLLTTRFSTVLQYATRDTADAFRELGWEALVLIEPKPSHRLYQHVIRQALAEFKPDLVFQIDHLRHEHRDLFPANLPFVCWGQDHLPNLITPDAGRRVGPLDFVLTDNPVGYSKNYAYPARQLISTPKLAVASKTPVKRDTPGPNAEDVVFVSNASRQPAELLNEILKEWDGSQDAFGVLLDAAQDVLHAYAAGKAVSTYGEIRAFITEASNRRGVRLPADEFLNVSKWLTHPFNDALYRQQALRWTASASQDAGLSFGLYGKGWDAHPEFSRFARGPVEYGDGLRALTQRAAINLQIVPYLCLHQRLLDGLAAGGFFLIRQNPNDVYPQALLNFIDANVGENLRTTEQIRQRIKTELRPQFESLLNAAALGTISTEGEDAVTLIREWAEAGNLEPGGEVLPRLLDVSFDGEKRLAELLKRFANANELRAEIAAEQRAAVVARLSYNAGIGRVQRRIAELLRETAREGVRTCA